MGVESPSKAQRGRVAFAAVALGVAYLIGAYLQSRFVNTDYALHDQTAYMESAQWIAVDPWDRYANRMQMPAIPMFLLLFVRQGESFAAFFPRAKLLCLALSVPLITFVVVTFFRTLPRLPALVLSLLVGFFVFSFRAGYVQAELLSYTSMFAVFLCMCRFWRSPGVPLAVLTGAVLAGAYLAKGTALLGFYVFVATFAVREILLLREQPLQRLKNLGALTVTAGTFALLIYPYARNSKGLFNSYLFNMSSTYVMWCDSWDHFLELQAKLHLHPDGWKLPKDQVPSFSNYVASHSLGTMLKREVLGLGEMLGNCVLSHGYMPVVFLYLFATIGLLVQNPALRRRVFRVHRDSRGPFIVLYVLVHLALFGWYAPIAAGNRFSLGVLLPGMFAVVSTMSREATPGDTLRVGSMVADWGKVNRAALALLVLELVGYYPWAIVTHYSGG